MAHLTDVGISVYVIYMAEASFSAYALKGKTACFSHFETKLGKQEGKKHDLDLVVLLLTEKCTFSKFEATFS